MSRLLPGLFFALLLLPGCPREETSAPRGLAPPTRPALARSALVVAEAAPDVAPVPARPAPIEKRVPEPAEPAQELSTRPLERPSKPLDTICMRVCNKAQQCGTARGSVTDCVGECLGIMRAGDAAPTEKVGAYRAQERCADVACKVFEGCVGKALLGERALAAAPAVSPAEADSRCKRLCAKEKECHPARLAARPEGLKSCISSCVQVFINPTEQVASQRLLMNRVLGCLDKPCPEFEICARRPLAD